MACERVDRSEAVGANRLHEEHAREVEGLRTPAPHEVRLRAVHAQGGVEVVEYDDLGVRALLAYDRSEVEVAEVSLQSLYWGLGVRRMRNYHRQGPAAPLSEGVPVYRQQHGGQLVNLELEAPSGALRHSQLVAVVAADRCCGCDLVVISHQDLGC